MLSKLGRDFNFNYKKNMILVLTLNESCTTCNSLWKFDEMMSLELLFHSQFALNIPLVSENSVFPRNFLLAGGPEKAIKSKLLRDLMNYLEQQNHDNTSRSICIVRALLFISSRCPYGAYMRLLWNKKRETQSPKI